MKNMFNVTTTFSGLHLEARKCSAAQGPYSEVFRALSKDLCRKVLTNARVHLQELVRQNGGHIEHVLH